MNLSLKENRVARSDKLRAPEIQFKGEPEDLSKTAPAPACWPWNALGSETKN
jgi:hypothetical protein